MRRSELFGAVLAGALLVAHNAYSIDGSTAVAPVVAAERAFAADGLAMGIKGSFVKHAAPEGIVFIDKPVKAREFYGARPDKAHPPLVWWPVYAGVSKSGDLGFTTGPATFGGKPSGWYFTVWKKQADGSWKWVYDGGPPSDTAGAPGPEAPVAALPVATTGTRDAYRAVTAKEALLAKAAETDVAAAYGPVLAVDSLIVGSPAAPLATPDGQARELAARAKAIRFTPLGGEASKAGDLVWTYGAAEWTAGDKSSRGHYVRVWQHRAAGWALVYDLLLPASANS